MSRISVGTVNETATSLPVPVTWTALRPRRDACPAAHEVRGREAAADDVAQVFRGLVIARVGAQHAADAAVDVHAHVNHCTAES